MAPIVKVNFLFRAPLEIITTICAWLSMDICVRSLSYACVRQKCVQITLPHAPDTELLPGRIWEDFKYVLCMKYC